MLNKQNFSPNSPWIMLRKFKTLCVLYRRRFLCIAQSQILHKGLTLLDMTHGHGQIDIKMAHDTKMAHGH
jgi:hypothetical protein